MPHVHEKVDFVADVLVVNGDAVLLRMHDKYHTWLAPGGHIELDEDPPTAALREVREETGLDVKLVGEVPADMTDGERELLVPRFLNRHPISPIHDHIVFMYFGTCDTREVSQGATEVSDEMKWFTREELDDPKYGIKERIKFYARAALDELGTKSQK